MKPAVIVVAMIVTCVCMTQYASCTSMSSTTRVDMSIPKQDFCPVCTSLLPDILKGLNNNSTLQEIENALNKACALFPSKEKAKCQGIIKSFIAVLNSGDKSLLERYSVYTVCSILGVCEVDCCESPAIPEQIHLAMTTDPSEMRVGWTTLDATEGINVQVSTTPFDKSSPSFEEAKQAQCESHTYTTGGWTGTLHSCLMTGLAPNTKYYYRVGSPVEQSQPILYFTTRDPNATHLNIAVFADMGATDVSDPSVMQLVMQRNDLDFIIGGGDLSYADLDQTLWDSMGRKMEPVVGYLPYMVCPGNHESFAKFAAYQNRFGVYMPWQESGSNSSLYYSFDYGNTHFLSLNTEANDDMIADFSAQTPAFSFIEADLEKASSNPQIDWIIVYGHRPFYCSNHHSVDCLTNADIFKRNLEPSFKKFGVDLVITGHKHDYERCGPVFQEQMDEDAPVYVVNGVGGSREHLMDSFLKPAPVWSKTTISKYGVSTLNINGTTLNWKLTEDVTGVVLDHITLDPRKKMHQMN